MNIWQIHPRTFDTNVRLAIMIAPHVIFKCSLKLYIYIVPFILHYVKIHFTNRCYIIWDVIMLSSSEKQEKTQIA